MTNKEDEFTGEGTTAHRFHFSKDGMATCSCGGWAITRMPMTAARAQRLATRYGKERFGPHANAILQTGVPFTELTEAEANKDWECHVKNRPEKGGRVNGCRYLRKQRKTRRQKSRNRCLAYGQTKHRRGKQWIT